EKGGDCGTMDSPGGEASPGAQMKSAFKGLFGKKKGDGADAKDEGKDASKGSGTPGMKKLFGTSTEVTSITTGSAPADAFEPPAGFKKKDPPKIEAPKKCRPLSVTARNALTLLTSARGRAPARPCRGGRAPSTSFFSRKRLSWREFVHRR